MHLRLHLQIAFHVQHLGRGFGRAISRLARQSMQGAARANRGCPCVFPVRWRFVFDECCEYSRNAVLAHDPSVELLACNRFLLRLSAHCEAMTGGCTGGGIKSFFSTFFSTGGCFKTNAMRSDRAKSALLRAVES